MESRKVKHISVILLIVILLFGSTTTAAVGDDFAYRVASKCLGEASFALEGCAWSVVNRLEAGWAKSKVLTAYNAPSVTPTNEEVELIRPILDGTTEQENPNYYYMFSLQDVQYLGSRLNQDTLIDKIVHIPNRSEIWFYSIKALK